MEFKEKKEEKTIRTTEIFYKTVVQYDGRVLRDYQSKDGSFFTLRCLNSDLFTSEFVNSWDVRRIAEEAGIEDLNLGRNCVVLCNISGMANSEIKKRIEREHKKVITFLKKVIKACESLRIEREKIMKSVLKLGGAELEI